MPTKRIAIHDPASHVMDAWFNSLLDRGLGIVDALDEIEAAYPEGSVPFGNEIKWALFRNWQLDQVPYADFWQPFPSKES